MHVPFGAYVLAKDEPTPYNSIASRTVDCLYLQPVLEIVQGGHELYNLNTKRVMTRLTVTELPVPFRIMKLVSEIAEQDNMKSFKFVSCSIAGVDNILQHKLDAENFKDDEEEDYEYEPEDDEELIADEEERLDEAQIDDNAGVLEQ